MKVLLRVLLLSIGTGVTACGTTRDSILFAGKKPQTVRLIESTTARPIANAEIRLRPDSMIGCEKAQCAADGSMWKARTDRTGHVVIPKRFIDMQATVELDPYMDDLLDNATLEKSGEWVLELTRKDSSGATPYAAKIFDEKTREPFVNERIMLEFTDVQGARHNVLLTTNSFGYVFIQPQIAAMGRHTTLKMPHYWVEFINFADPHRNFYLKRYTGTNDHDRELYP